MRDSVLHQEADRLQPRPQAVQPECVQAGSKAILQKCPPELLQTSALHRLSLKMSTYLCFPFLYFLFTMNLQTIEH